MTQDTKEILYKVVPGMLALVLISGVAIKYINPAPPKKMVIATGDGEGDYQAFAKQYKELIKGDGIELVLRSTHGAMDNVKLLLDEKSDVDVAFVQDGLVSGEKATNLMSLGSLYYEPLWIFYSHKIELPHHTDLTKLSQLKGKKIGVGEEGSGTTVLAMRLLKASGIDEKNSKIIHQNWSESEKDLRAGQLDVAFMVAPPEDPLIEALLEDGEIFPMSLDQAEGIHAQLPFLHHLTLAHGSISLAKNLPAKDLELVAPTATLLAKETLHPALVYLLLKSASDVHNDPGIFEKKNEFPADKDYEVSISPEAKNYYKTGVPFWQKYLPFWLATLAERLLIIAVPFFAFVLPGLKMIPRFLQWRDRNKILRCYAELKYLENKVMQEKNAEHSLRYLKDLIKIELKVNRLKLPIEYAEDLYGLRSHIHFVKDRLKADYNLTESS
jgi:TRAP transporter TAXI family solute receptor